MKNLIIIFSFIFLIILQKNTFPQEWEFLGLSGEGVRTITIDPKNEDIIYVGSRGIGKIFKSTNSGATWDTLLTGVDVTNIVIHPDSSNILYATLAYKAGPGIIKSVDSGENWFKTDSGIHLDWETSVASLAINPSNTNIMFAGTVGFFGGYLYKSIDRGNYWEKIADDMFGNVGAIAIDKEDPQIILCSAFGQIFKSTDGGETWVVSYREASLCYVIKFDPNNHQTIYASTPPKLIKTTDSGITWIVEVDLGIYGNYSVSDVFIHFNTTYIVSFFGVWKKSENDTGWVNISGDIIGGRLAIGNGFLYLADIEGIYRYQINTSISTKQERKTNKLFIPKNFFLFQNYPNPFNSETTISYQLTKDGVVQLKIYNILGEQVKILISKKQSDGYYTIRWDGKDNNNQLLPSNIYFYQLQVNHHLSETRKMILTK